jgi:hypothetical protein
MSLSAALLSPKKITHFFECHYIYYALISIMRRVQQTLYLIKKVAKRRDIEMNTELTMDDFDEDLENFDFASEEHHNASCFSMEINANPDKNETKEEGDPSKEPYYASKINDCRSEGS